MSFFQPQITCSNLQPFMKYNVEQSQFNSINHDLTFSSGIKNPVLVANRLLTEAQRGKLSAGRIPPW